MTWCTNSHKVNSCLVLVCSSMDVQRQGKVRDPMINVNSTDVIAPVPSKQDLIKLCTELSWHTNILKLVQDLLQSSQPWYITVALPQLAHYYLTICWILWKLFPWKLKACSNRTLSSTVHSSGKGVKFGRSARDFSMLCLCQNNMPSALNKKGVFSGYQNTPCSFLNVLLPWCSTLIAILTCLWREYVVIFQAILLLCLLSTFQNSVSQNMITFLS